VRHANNFQPEWGYLAPAPSFMRTAGISLVAMAVGATAGAGVLLSLVDHPVVAIGATSVAGHRLAWPIEAEPAPFGTPQTAQVAKPGATNGQRGVLVVSEPSIRSTAMPANITVMAEAPATATPPAKIADTEPGVTPSVEKRATKRNRPSSRSLWWGGGSLAFLNPFKTRGKSQRTFGLVLKRPFRYWV
jgi:hypothetical protein